MNPNLIEGDVVLVNKIAYDVKIPFLGRNFFQLSNPERGDVVAFDKDGTLFVKRVMALPGDTVQVIRNSFYVNGEKLKITNAKIQAVEENKLPYSKKFNFEAYLETNKLSNKTPKNYHVVYATGLSKRLRESLVVNTIEYTIPNNSYFMIGDNRNLSYDSRFFGPIPRESIVGNVTTTMFNYREAFTKVLNWGT